MKSLQYKQQMTITILTIFLIIVLYSCSEASINIYLNEQWQISTPEEQGMDSGKLIAMMEKIKEVNYSIDSITIIRNGYMVTDAYLHPYIKNTKHVIHSCTKSITSSLIGIALDRGYIKSVNAPVLEFFSEKTISNLNEQKNP